VSADTGSVPSTEPAWVSDVLRFWLEETPFEARFRRDEALDRRIQERFSALHAGIGGGGVALEPFTARLVLAAIIVLDQFSRNMFRGTPAAFASDGQALALAERAISAGFDRATQNDGRLFFYLPFEHAEDLALQDRSVALIAGIGNPELDRYAVAHRDIVARFGRFPHRNAALGRVTTPEEAEFLEQPGSSF
jgi:uncharacterized protein (DUF924 family)